MSGSELADKRGLPGLIFRAKRSVKRSLGPAGVFVKGAIEHPVMVGAVMPSSAASVKAMLKRVDWDSCKLFVEYGPGTGRFTQPILDRLPRDAELLVIDTNPIFIEYLTKTITDSRLKAVLGSAAEVEEIVQSLGHEEACYVLSGLPFSNLPEGVGEQIVEATYKVLKSGGGFLTYQYKLVARELTKARFDRFDKTTVLANLPPNHLTWGWKD